ncbi:MAG: hypothetical protein IT430_16145 [Phycisphaerales bacterium]|nr:hypothetical protein [Phycisphaerales bacterium]
MIQRFAFVSSACAASVLALASGALAQYSTGFEVSDGINASSGGTVLTGQDSYYLPSGTDYLAFTYAGNSYGVASNPQGGSQFVAVQGPGGGIYGRAQRDINWGNTGGATVTFDAAALYTGAPPASNNIGSFSAQPYPGSASYIQLFTYGDVNNPTSWQCGYLAYDANGVALLAPGLLPGPEWTNLSMNHWYRFRTKIDFATNQIVEASITDLTTNQTTTAPVSGAYLEGGSAGGRPLPTGFRMFSGGGAVGNIAAFDNMNIAPATAGFACTITGTCPGQVNLSWSGGPANKPMGIVFARNTGNFTIGSGPCAGTQLGLGTNQLQLYNTINTGNGAGSVNAQASSGACGGFVQLVAVDTPCKTSNVAQVP